VVENAEMVRVARMVPETQRVGVRLLWDDQKMRQTMVAAAGLDKLGKAMAARRVQKVALPLLPWV
jgi:hypothetical protein